MYELVVNLDFAAAHHLRGYHGKCESLHGHNWNVTVKVASDGLDSLGMVMDFKELKALCGAIFERLDHKHLNEVAPFDTINPTTENLARHIYERLSENLPAHVTVVEVTTWESADCGAVYRKD